MWYGASLFFEGVHPDQPGAENVWEEQVVLISASTEDEARQQAERLGKAAEHSYLSATNETVQWQFRKVDRVQEIDDETLMNGTEVFSRFLKASEVNSLSRPISEPIANHAVVISG